MLVSSLVALGMLPVQLIGVVLLVASVVFFVLELLHPGVGPSAIAGVISLVLGGLFLFDTSVPGVSVSWLVIVPVAVFAAFFFLVVVRSDACDTGRSPPGTSSSSAPRDRRAQTSTRPASCRSRPRSGRRAVRGAPARATASAS